MDTTALVEQKYRNQVVSISNSVIRSREFTNLLESKIEVLAIYYMDSDLRTREKLDAHGNTYKVNYVELTASDIKKLMGRSDGAAYQEIYRAAHNLEEKLYIIEDRENRSFSMQHMYGDISYDRGILGIEFNPDMTKYFLNLKDNFTKLKLPILFSFKRNGGFQLYKLLKSYAYAPVLEPINMSLEQDELPEIELSWSLTDLRMIMGYVDINQKELKREGQKKNPDFLKMSQVEKQPQYKRWTDFKKRVIDPGIEEINKISDIYISGMEKVRSGYGGKVSKIVFRIQHNKKYYEKERPGAIHKTEDETSSTTVIMTEEQKYDFADEMRSFMGDLKLKTRDLISIAEAAGYDMELIERQYQISKSSNVDNIVGWMISAVRRGYDSPVSAAKKQADNDYNRFELEREYDFDALENKIVNRHAV